MPAARTLSLKLPSSAPDHGKQMRAVLAISSTNISILSDHRAITALPSTALSRPRLGHQLNPRVRNTCPIVQILHCLDPISMC